MFERFTKAARAAVVEAQTEARRLGHDRIGTGNVLLSLTTSEGIAAEALSEAGITHDSVELALTASVPDDDSGDDDAEALEALGIDLEAIKRTVEASFGEGALSRPSPARATCRSPRAPRRLSSWRCERLCIWATTTSNRAHPLGTVAQQHEFGVRDAHRDGR